LNARRSPEIKIGGVKIRGVALIAVALPALQTAGTLTLSPNGTTVYDSVNNVNWLADANLAASETFGLPVCSGAVTQVCVSASGLMDYGSATAWIQAMNAANYLGYNNWQMPTTPPIDATCGKTGPNGNSFGFGCLNGSLGNLYYSPGALGLTPPNTAVTVPANTTGPFGNFQPYLYWSGLNAGSKGYATVSFASGFEGANTVDNFLYAIPMVPGKISGAPAGQTVYDPVSNVTWLANANLAATNTFGLPVCATPTSPALCVSRSGAMTIASVLQFITLMNSYNGTGYLGQKNWQLPPMDQTCTGYTCSESGDPLAELFYGVLGLGKGIPAVPGPTQGAGPFLHLQPYLYWSCAGATVASACDAAGAAPGFQFTFSFGNGFLGTDILTNIFYAMAYYVGPASTVSGPQIAEVVNAEGESPAIAPNTWVAIRGVNLGPAGDARTWLASDFTGTQMPTQLDGVSVTVNGKSAYVEYISPTQINILTPSTAISGTVQVVVSNNGKATPAFPAQSQALSPSFFVFNGGYVAATHANGSLLGPATLYPGYTTPAKPGETIVLYANGFGPTQTPIAAGSVVQSGTLATLPVVTIGNATASVAFAGLVAPGEFQFNVVVPSSVPNGDQPITATYGGMTTQTGALVTIQR